ncbi:hypothetical protein [Absidia glauca]|uniref:Uncharacterized protein n=1 Tax=Absidia glauca TaxID=4829 RepID=A0A168MDY4_ABSGL|nr:hypothetical protein [Absidia glauca]
MNAFTRSARIVAKPARLGTLLYIPHRPSCFYITDINDFTLSHSLARFYATEAPATTDKLRLTFVLPHKVKY